jgi:formylglycine-generating enzyme required for sulfatase activity
LPSKHLLAIIAGRIATWRINVKGGKIYTAKLTFLLLLPLLWCLLLPVVADGRAEAAPGSVVAPEGGARGTIGKAAAEVPVVQIEGPNAGLVVGQSSPPIPALGSLIVLTSPPGARVFLDGQEQKGKSPLNIPDVLAGDHLVKVHLDQYYDAEQKVAVAVDWVSRVEFDLKGGHLEACGDQWLESEAAVRCRAEEEERKVAVLIGEFVKVAGGCFQMGDTVGAGWSDEKPVHEVCLDGFAIAKYEVTQGQWLAVMGRNPSYFKKGNNFPVEQVSWAEVQNFVSRLNTLTGRNFRLPSEAEWEYAARSGGKKELYAGGDNLGVLAWYVGNAGPFSHAVGTRQPNGLGIYDMSGNVAEWVQDWYDSEYYKISPRNNPVGPLGGCSGRVIRGGGWNIDAGLARAANRDRYEPTNRFAAVGFRLAYSIK